MSVRQRRTRRGADHVAVWNRHHQFALCMHMRDLDPHHFYVKPTAWRRAELPYAASYFLFNPKVHRRFICGDPSLSHQKGMTYITGVVDKVDPEVGLPPCTARDRRLRRAIPLLTVLMHFRCLPHQSHSIVRVADEDDHFHRVDRTAHIRGPHCRYWHAYPPVGSEARHARALANQLLSGRRGGQCTWRPLLCLAGDSIGLRVH